jgi:DNA-binding transcriptional ArsR family regulator
MEWEARFDFIKRAGVLKALAHPSRLYFVTRLEGGEQCVQDLAEMVDVDVSTASKHLSILRNAGILQDEKRGARVWYSLRSPCVLEFIACLDEVRS